jgi:hypothetical protein
MGWSKIESAWPQTLWGALYQTGKNEISALNSLVRKDGGNNVQIKFDKIQQ